MRHTKRYIGLMVAAALMLQMILPGTGVYAKVSKPKLSTKTAKVEVSAKKKITVKIMWRRLQLPEKIIKKFRTHMRQFDLRM